MNQQDLVWVKLPFSDLNQSNVRPALVVSNDKYNKSNPDIVVCAVTSNLKESGYNVVIDDNDLSSGNIPLKSMVRADKLLQIEKALVIMPLATLCDKTFDRVITEILKLVKRHSRKQ